MRSAMLAVCLLLLVASANAETYEVGPGQTLENIGDVPWESLTAGDVVHIHWRDTPYKEKWVIGVQGSEQQPIVISGVPGNGGELPVFDGRDATTRSQLNFWSEVRGGVKFGGSNTPPDVSPTWIVLENLDIRSGRSPYQFTGRDGLTDYSDNAASIFIEKGEHITIRNCILRDSGNGLFASHTARDVTVEGCWIYDNGIEGSIYMHNNYTEAFGITFQYNYFGPLRDGCDGNNLKDRSAGTVVRYNWIEGGNRQLDLVDSDYPEFYDDPLYEETFVYGNVLIEPEGAGNSQIVHYGGDSGDTQRYRKGTLYFYNNTVVSTREGNTTLFRLSTNEESCDCRNNIVYVTADGDRLAMLNSDGILSIRNNWFKTGWRDSHSGLNGQISDEGGMVTGDEPGFIDTGTQNFHLSAGASDCIDAGTDLHPGAAATHGVERQYVRHCSSEPRPVDGTFDIGAFEAGETDDVPPQPPTGMVVEPI